MGYPKQQYVLARTRGTKTSYFYGPKLGTLVTTHISVGDTFGYAKLKTSPWRVGKRSSEKTYSTES